MIIQSNNWKELWCQCGSDAQKFGINLVDKDQIATEKDYKDGVSSDIPSLLTLMKGRYLKHQFHNLFTVVIWPSSISLIPILVIWSNSLPILGSLLTADYQGFSLHLKSFKMTFFTPQEVTQGLEQKFSFLNMSWWLRQNPMTTEMMTRVKKKKWMNTNSLCKMAQFSLIVTVMIKNWNLWQIMAKKL